MLDAAGWHDSRKPWQQTEVPSLPGILTGGGGGAGSTWGSASYGAAVLQNHPENTSMLKPLTLARRKLRHRGQTQETAPAVKHVKAGRATQAEDMGLLSNAQGKLSAALVRSLLL